MEPSGRKYAFGLYEADPRTGELRKSGMKLRIQEQPFQILIELLEHPNEVVTREELRAKLWQEDTFVDFDHGLNTAINKLREVLGDSASNPRFVETLARRGYRFIAPVKVMGEETRKIEVPAVPAPAPEIVSPAVEVPQVGTVGPTPEFQEVAPVLAVEVENSPVPHVPPSEATANVGIFPTESKSSGSDDELPLPSRRISRTLFALAQVMYLIFYGVALVNFDQLPILVGNFLGGKVETAVEPIVLVTAAVGIALRLYLLTAVLFDFKPLGAKFKRLYPFILPLDQLWALAPFLLVSRIGIGAAFAACAALLYLPFSERTLIKMAYKWQS